MLYGYIISQSVRLKQVHTECLLNRSLSLVRWPGVAPYVYIYIYLSHIIAPCERRPYRDVAFSPAVFRRRRRARNMRVRAGFISCSTRGAKPSVSLLLCRIKKEEGGEHSKGLRGLWMDLSP